MRGRGRDQAARGTRNPATSGRGPAARGTRPPQRTGTIPAIGAYLDIGKEINHGSVSAWMRKFKEYIRANFKSDINSIFGDEGVPGAYPIYVEPDDLLEDATFMQQTVWKRQSERFDKLTHG